ncbi:MAG: hypothetical protein K8F57_06190, partial [Alphaproteobacteria bacterium]|nr:hypothetical protein [Alphaproteobacteria bacterium]
DHLAHRRWDALFDPGNRPSDLDDAPGLVVTDPRWTAINRKCPGILLVERKADGRDLKMGVNIVDGKLRIAPSLLRFYKVDLDKDGKLEDAIIKGYNGVYTYSKRHIKKIDILNVYECKIVSRVSVHFNGSVDFFILDNIYYMSNGRPLYYSNRILGFVEKENGGIREWTFGDIYGILTIKEFMERNIYINPYYFGRLTDGERKALKGGSDD